MKIIVNEDPFVSETQVEITCKKKTSIIDKITNYILKSSIQINGKIKNEYVKISADNIYYIECVDNKTFIYSKENIYENKMKLYELEKLLEGTSLIRVNKSCIMNTDKLKSVKGMVNGRLMATLENEEKIIVNRSYVQKLKNKLKF